MVVKVKSVAIEVTTCRGRNGQPSPLQGDEELVTLLHKLMLVGHVAIELKGAHQTPFAVEMTCDGSDTSVK